jgi:hypothetical protein
VTNLLFENIVEYVFKTFISPAPKPLSKEQSY